MELKTCNILGLDILVTDMEKTVNLIEQNIEQLRGKYICVGNVHTTVMAHDDPQYHTVQADAAFVLPDGGPLSGYSRKHGFPEAERVTGPDLMLALFARDNGLKHYFYVVWLPLLKILCRIIESFFLMTGVTNSPTNSASSRTRHSRPCFIAGGQNKFCLA